MSNFNLSNIENIKYPWLIPFHQRYHNLIAKDFKIAYYYHEVNDSTFRYRAYNMCQALSESCNTSVTGSYFFSKDFTQFEKISNVADILVVCRSGMNYFTENIINKFKKLNKKIFFDIDDYVFDTKHLCLILNSLNLSYTNESLWNEWYAYTARAADTLLSVDAAITTNNYLAEKISDFSGVTTHVIPNFMNNEQLQVSEKCRETKSRQNDTIRIGYFSGSPSHKKDFDVVAHDLLKILKNDDSVELVIAGYIDVNLHGLESVMHKIHYLPFTNYLNLQKYISSVDINIAPLQFNEFTNCKSELKFFEAASVNTITIATPTFTFKNSIKDGVTGYLSEEHQWHEKLSSLINSIRLNNHHEMVQNGLNYVLDKYTPRAQVNNLLDVFL